jgi:hypothetical protein
LRQKLIKKFEVLSVHSVVLKRDNCKAERMNAATSLVICLFSVLTLPWLAVNERVGSWKLPAASRAHKKCFHKI